MQLPSEKPGKHNFHQANFHDSVHAHGINRLTELLKNYIMQGALSNPGV